MKPTKNGSHWYQTDGTPLHWVPKKDGSGNRATTLADARKLNLLPSVTHILNLLDKPALNAWKVREGVIAVTTAPDVPGESLDAKITRVLDTEEQQEETAQAARDLGTEIHEACEAYFTGADVPEWLMDMIRPACLEVAKYGSPVATEKILVGEGYAGRTDLIMESVPCWWLWDFKSAKTLPNPKKGAWLEHRLQLAAYAKAFHRMLANAGPGDPHNNSATKPIRTANCYISTVERGKFVICEHDGAWPDLYYWGFETILKFWQGANQYTPKQ